MDLGALALGCEAGDGPHLDLDACVELLVSHVPYALDRGGNRFVLQIESSLECEETNGNPVAVGPPDQQRLFEHDWTGSSIPN